MSAKLKRFIAIGILINVLLAGGIYVNYRLDQVVSSLDRPGVMFADTQSPGLEDVSGEVAQQIDNNEYWNGSWYDGAGRDAGGYKPDKGSGANSDETSGGTLERPSNLQIANDVAAKAGRPIEKTDIIKAGLIILKRLNSEEITYLYHVGRKDSITMDERTKVKTILSARLTDDDIKTLKALGKKYGRNLTVLD